MTPLQHKSIPWFESSVGYKAVQGVCTVMTHYSADLAAVITSSGFRRSAWHLSASTRFVLFLHSEVDRLDEQRAAGLGSRPGLK
jgi:hypothetical protein